MDQEEKKELFRKVVDIADTAKSILDYKQSDEAGIFIIQLASSADLSKDDLYDLVTAHQSGSEEELEKAVVNITIDTLCRLL